MTDAPFTQPSVIYDLILTVALLPLVRSLLRSVVSGVYAVQALRRRRLQEVGLRALIGALAARDNYTSDHSEAVVGLAGGVARALGLSRSMIRYVEQVALLHDVGKIGIPDSILNKQGPLTDEEWVLMKQHPCISEKIVSEIKGLAELGPALRAEHERWDGLGYPDGLSGRSIPLASRIILACDAYHAMVSDRSYRSAMSLPAAFQELERNAGSQFCPDTVHALLGLLNDAAQVLTIGYTPSTPVMAASR